MKQFNFLFWNTYKKDLSEEILDLVSINSSNFLVFLENTSNDEFLLNALKNINQNFKQFNTRIFKKPKIFSSIENISITEIIGHGRYGIYEISLNTYEKALLAIVHFPSKKDWGNDSDYLGLCVELKIDIEKAELDTGTRNTILLGDFNMNPFEEGLINSSALHNVNSKEIALTKQRYFQKRYYDFFYNPMWSFLGDNSKGNAQGTHFFNTYKPICHFWNLYDQVIIRPELIETFDENELDIITNIKSKSLLKTNNGFTIINKNISDHLPIKFQLKIKKDEFNEKLMAI